MSSIRILIADSFRDWRQKLCSILHARREWQIVYEASDGSEAIQNAEKLKPDLVLLEIRLSNPNGIEVARRIHQLSPNSKIVFIGLDNSLDVLEVALSTGAKGYVYKAAAATDLQPAIDAVLRGEEFVSSGVRGYKFTDIPEAKVSHHHELLFYSDDIVFLDGFARFIAAALQSDIVAIALVTKSHQESLVKRLEPQGLDIDGAIQQGAFILLDVADTLATLLVDGLPDPLRFFESFRSLIETALKSAKSGRPRVAFCSECIGRFWAEGKTDAALRLEQVCNDLATTYDVDLLCAYPFTGYGRDDERILQRICAEHSAVRRE